MTKNNNDKLIKKVSNQTKEIFDTYSCRDPRSVSNTLKILAVEDENQYIQETFDNNFFLWTK